MNLSETIAHVVYPDNFRGVVLVVEIDSMLDCSSSVLVYQRENVEACEGACVEHRLALVRGPMGGDGNYLHYNQHILRIISVVQRVISVKRRKLFM